jgi:hypothetical protein
MYQQHTFWDDYFAEFSGIICCGPAWAISSALIYFGVIGITGFFITWVVLSVVFAAAVIPTRMAYLRRKDMRELSRRAAFISADLEARRIRLT